jgi:succinate dehydrogenase / fumarate reductase cytochrome b subunit
MTGLVLAFSAFLLAILLITATYGPEAFKVAQLYLSSWFGKMVLLGLTFSIYFHLANGIRHLGWDFGMGFNLPKVQATGIAVILFAIALTVLTWFAGYSVAGGF